MSQPIQARAAGQPAPAGKENATAEKIRVLIVDDSADIIRTLGPCIDLEPDLVTVGGLPSAEHLADEIERLRPDVVLLDVRMPGPDPLKVLDDIVRTIDGPDGWPPRVVVFSGADDRKTAAAALAAGARSLLSKGAAIPTMLDAIRQAAAAPGDEGGFKVWR